MEIAIGLVERCVKAQILQNDFRELLCILLIASEM